MLLVELAKCELREVGKKERKSVISRPANKHFINFQCSIAGAVISCILWIKEDTDMNLIKENPDKYGNLEYSSYLSTLKNDLFAIDLFFIYVKLFEYLNFNRTMAQLNNTLHRVSIICT